MKTNNNFRYRLLPFNFMRFKESHFLLVNLVGEYILLSDKEFKKTIEYSLEKNAETYKNLHAKHFLAETLAEPCVELLAVKYRTKKYFLNDFTSLHMFVITQRCNQKCVYCQVSSKQMKASSLDMNQKIAKRAVDITLSSPAQNIKIEFQGGEPLLNFGVIKFIVKYAKEQASRVNKDVEFVLCTNLTMITDKILKFLSDENIYISTSLDGPYYVHDKQRTYQNGAGCYDDLIKSLGKVRKYIKQENISALMTTTRFSLEYPNEIVDEYVEQGFTSIFIRPLNPFGYAKEQIKLLGYSAYEFIDFYKRALDRIIEINISGIYLEEYFATLLLTRILTPFSTGFVDLQFPTGAGILGVVYGHNGNVYPSDEARMLAQTGDDTFLMGNLENDNYRNLFYSTKMQDIISCSCAENLPGCSDCVFQMYCGIDPVRNYATQHDIIGHRPSDQSCIIHKEIITYLFEMILGDDKDKMDVFWSWITKRKLKDIRFSQ